MDYKNKFIVKFRGIRGSYPTPKADCLVYGGNTACVEVRVNNHLIILDAGTGIINLGNIYHEELEDILNTKIVKGMIEGFKNNKKCQELCKHCSFKEKF